MAISYPFDAYCHLSEFVDIIRQNLIQYKRNNNSFCHLLETNLFFVFSVKYFFIQLLNLFLLGLNGDCKEKKLKLKSSILKIFNLISSLRRQLIFLFLLLATQSIE